MTDILEAIGVVEEKTPHTERLYLPEIARDVQAKGTALGSVATAEVEILYIIGGDDRHYLLIPIEDQLFVVNRLETEQSDSKLARAKLLEQNPNDGKPRTGLNFGMLSIVNCEVKIPQPEIEHGAPVVFDGLDRVTRRYNPNRRFQLPKVSGGYYL